MNVSVNACQCIAEKVSESNNKNKNKNKKTHSRGKRDSDTDRLHSEVSRCRSLYNAVFSCQWVRSDIDHKPLSGTSELMISAHTPTPTPLLTYPRFHAVRKKLEIHKRPQLIRIQNVHPPENFYPRERKA